MEEHKIQDFFNILFENPFKIKKNLEYFPYGK